MSLQKLGTLMADAARHYGGMRPTSRLVLHFDGACEPRNPGGVATGGWIVTADDGTVLHEASRVFCQGEGATNNVAEYCALGYGLKWISERLLFVSQLGIDEVACFGDSQLVVNQVSGEWRCNKPHLEKLRDHCRELIEEIKTAEVAVTLQWIPRLQNEAADALSRQAYERHTGKNFPVRR